MVSVAQGKWGLWYIWGEQCYWKTATSEVSSIGKMYVPEISEGATNTRSSVEEDPQSESVTYSRTLSGGLQSPRAVVPKTAILQRINSKKASKSYQLGHQLSLKWSTGAGPRIGCVADYPIELRTQAYPFFIHANGRPCIAFSLSIL